MTRPESSPFPVFKTRDEARGYLLGYLGLHPELVGCRYPYYHGTIRRHFDSIRQVGVVPMLGRFVEEVYAGDSEEYGIELREVAFAAGPGDADHAIGAMMHHLEDALRVSDWRKLTVLQIARSGMIVCVDLTGVDDLWLRDDRGGATHLSFEDGVLRKDHNWIDEDPPHQTEPGDIYTTDGSFSADSFILGYDLILFIEKHDPDFLDDLNDPRWDEFNAFVERRGEQIAATPELRRWVLATGESWGSLTETKQAPDPRQIGLFPP